jgi:hypothetical protein
MDLEKARENDERLLAAVGRLVVTWAHLEFALDAMILFVYRGGYNEHEPELPRALNRKLDFLRGVFNKGQLAQAEKESHLAFLDAVAVESVTRHDIIHGYPRHHPSDDGEAKLTRLLINKTGWQERHVTITIASVTEATARAQRLSELGRDAAIMLGERYLEHFGIPLPPHDEPTA